MAAIDEEIEKLLEVVKKKIGPKVRVAANNRVHGVISLSIHLQDGKVNHIKSGFEEVTKPE